MRLHRYFKRIMVVSVATSLVVAAVSLRADAAGLAFDSVEVSSTLFNPSAGGNVVVTFLLTQDARVTATVCDADHYPVATVADGRACYTGVNKLSWNGRDDDGQVVPDEAYTVRLEAVDDIGATAVYDATLTTGGEPIRFVTTTIDKENERVRFQLPSAARVQIRCGIHGGPLLVTLLDWVPRPAGEHEIAWDGYDQSHATRVWDDAKFRLTATAYKLPENCIITTGNNTGYMEYWNRVASKYKMTASQLRLTTEAGLWANAQAKAARVRALNEDRARLGSAFLSGKFMNQMPEFSLEVGQISEKTASISITVSSSYKQLLDEQRFEYVMFVDGVLEGEQETGYSPYSWVLNADELSAGKHLVTVNIATLNGQVGAASTWIDVKE